MKSKTLSFLIFAFSIIVIISGCKNSLTESNPCDDDSSNVIVYKPNIYIYPTESLNLKVNILFPHGGRVTTSIPIYDTKWDVTVQSNGIIDDEYQYLFYECNVPDLFQKKEGWVINKKNLNSFFINNMNISGFNTKEIKDFTDYWIPKLNEFDYYEIYPQYCLDIEKMIILKFSKEPDNIFRLFYYIKGIHNNQFKLKQPIIEKSKREKYYIMEWGVIIK